MLKIEARVGDDTIDGNLVEGFVQREVALEPNNAATVDESGAQGQIAASSARDSAVEGGHGHQSETQPSKDNATSEANSEAQLAVPAIDGNTATGAERGLVHIEAGKEKRVETKDELTDVDAISGNALRVPPVLSSVGEAPHAGKESSVVIWGPSKSHEAKAGSKDEPICLEVAPKHGPQDCPAVRARPGDSALEVDASGDQDLKVGVKDEPIDLDTMPVISPRAASVALSVGSSISNSELAKKKARVKRLAVEIETEERIARLKRQRRELEDEIEASET